jgi:hypothetical protein
MGNVTSDLLIWTPDELDTAEPDVYLATMAQSLEDGVGARLRKQESFIGCNLGTSTSFTADTTIRQVPFGIVHAWNYNEGMTVSGGLVTVPMDGIYTVQVVANFLGVNTTPGRINTYLFKGSSSIQFSSTYGNTATSRYANASIANSYKLVAGDSLSVKVASYDSNSNLSAGGGSGFSVVLTKPL